MSIRRYRKRQPIDVEAIMVDVGNLYEVAEWCGGRVFSIRVQVDPNDSEMTTLHDVGIKLLTKNRLAVASIGQYIYKDHEDYFHVADHDSFNLEYEEIKENNG